MPVCIIETKGLAGLARNGADTIALTLAHIGPVDPGTWVLHFRGEAQEVLSEPEALRLRAKLMGDLGAAEDAAGV